jgi:hypothetical protein
MLCFHPIAREAKQFSGDAKKRRLNLPQSGKDGRQKSATSADKKLFISA